MDWRKAERKHANNADVFGKDVVVKIQRAESPLAVRKSLTNPADFGFLKQAAKDTDLILDRLALEELNLSKASPTTERNFSDISTKLSPRSKQVGESILEITDPKSLTSKSGALAGSIVDDIGNAILTGQRPDNILKLMQTTKGHNLVRNTLNTTKEGSKVLPLVEDLFTQDILNSIETGGVINSKKLNSFLKNKELVNVFERINGKQALDFLRDLSNKRQKIARTFRSKKFAESFPEVKKIKPLTEKDFKKFLREKTTQFALAAGLLKLLGIPIVPVIETIAIAKSIAPSLTKLLKNNNIRRIIRGLETRPEAGRVLLIQLNKEIEKELNKS